ncbi:ABC transporter ATP-binding protein [Aureisphaera galaxeae]|uniref:ABC transporter ATP-binding protein n=1 Tax=Aureisphaera galaxeae TaxID=1538023 RepID=UPI002350D6CD|nr:ABC transporter ATP-binding protein [Aureisphaera galaxeae]MDC8003686.1 ABC transporter ATP-binding protein [Aureisphaera galaxeae]
MASEKEHIVLEAKALAIGYTSKKQRSVIAEGIQFQFSEGELVGLVGANGIGKSTLLRTLSGMQKALDGDVSILKRPLSSFPPAALATQLSVVLTEAPSSKNLSVTEFISLGRQPHTNWLGRLSEKDREMILWAMEQTDTLEIRERKCFELSDGQMQRVAIARALAQDTPLIILDEPTTHLDLYHRAYILKLLKRLANDTQKTILFSTHEIDLAIQLSDKMIVMTTDSIVVDEPCNLISQGHFTDLFPKDSIFFDEETGSFRVK